MKALSLLQPWASLVVMGAKTIETRSWQTAYRGELLIHASSGKSGALIAQEPPFTKYIADFYTLPFGAIIGKVSLVEIVSVDTLQLSDHVINKLSLEERAFGNYTKGRFAWMLEDAEMFDRTIPIKGSLGLWNFHF